MEADFLAGIEPVAEILALEHLLEGDPGVEPQDFLIGHLAEPIPVVHNLGLRFVQNLERLIGVGRGIGQHLRAGQRRARGGAPRGVAHRGGEVADEQHRLMPEQLELAEFFQCHGVAEMDVRGGGIHPELDAQRAAEPEFV